MLLNQIKPSPTLSDYIRFYRIIDFQFESHTVIPLKLYSPRPEHCLQFYPKDTETVIYPDGQNTVTNKKVIFTGQHTVLQHRCVGNNFLSVQVVFQPSAFYRITGIPMQELANAYVDAEDVISTAVQEVNDRSKLTSNGIQLIPILVSPTTPPTFYKKIHGYSLQYVA